MGPQAFQWAAEQGARSAWSLNLDVHVQVANWGGVQTPIFTVQASAQGIPMPPVGVGVEFQFPQFFHAAPPRPQASQQGPAELALAWAALRSDAGLEVNRLLARPGIINLDEPVALDPNHTAKTALGWACQAGNAVAVRSLIEAGADATVANESRQTPLHLAAYYAHSDCVGALLSRCPNVNLDARDRNGYTPLMLASSNGSVGIVKALVKDTAGADRDIAASSKSSAFSLAARNGHVDVVRYLADSPAIDPGQVVVDRDGRRSCTLGDAAANGHMEVVRFLVEERGFDPRGPRALSEGEPPAVLARKAGKLDVAHYLAEACKADVPQPLTGKRYSEQADDQSPKRQRLNPE